MFQQMNPDYDLVEKKCILEDPSGFVLECSA